MKIKLNGGLTATMSKDGKKYKVTISGMGMELKTRQFKTESDAKDYMQAIVKIDGVGK